MADQDRETRFDDSNEDIMYILENAQTKDPAIQKEFLLRCKMLDATLHQYEWAFKKRAGFDESSWKHMARRMSLLKKEGFDVRSNTRRAKEKKASAEVKESNLEQFFKKKELAKPKKKKKAD